MFSGLRFLPQERRGSGGNITVRVGELHVSPFRQRLTDKSARVRPMPTNRVAPAGNESTSPGREVRRFGSAITVPLSLVGLPAPSASCVRAYAHSSTRVNALTRYPTPEGTE